MSHIRFIGGVLGGYIVVVPIAVLVTVFFMALPTILPDEGRWGSFYSMTREMGSVLTAGLLITGATAWPGYGLTLLSALRANRPPSRLYFATCGGLTAVQAHLLFSFFSAPGAPLGIMISPVGIASILGGAIAGLAYSFMHVKLTGQNPTGRLASSRS